uniref:MADF domain-containing protein n=3 Tax=Lutzomyia longipalpis TaxID=7200 RepID=A0A1B0CI19_LUTLO
MGKKLGSFDTDLAYIKKHKLRERIGPEDKSLKLIKAIEKYPCLYDEKHPDYKQNKNQQPAWRKVSEMTNIPLLQCWSKFKALFFNFSTTYVILQDPTLVAQGLPKMFLYYEHMLFLKPFVKFHGIRKHHVPFIVKKIMKNRSAKEAKAQKNHQSRPATKQPQVNPWKPWMGDNPPNFGKSPPVSSDGSQSGPSTSQYSAAHLSDHPRAGNSKFSSFPIDEELSEKQIQQLQKYSLTFHKKLIKMVKQFPCLYNTNSQDYHNVEMKQIIWEEISKKCARSSNECRDAFNYLLKKFGETYVGKMVSRLGVPEETKRKPFQHYRELRFLKRYIPLQEVKDSLLQDPRYTLVQKMMITEFQHSPDTSPDISELRVPQQWDSPTNARDVWEEEPWENEFDREDLQLLEVDRLLPSRPQQWDRDADERDRVQWERDRMQERERENNLRDSQWERDSDRRGGPPQWEKENVLRGFQELERDHDSRDSPQWERDREARGSQQQWERDNENSDLRNNFSRNSHNPITPPPPQHYSGFSGGASGQTDPGNSQWNNTERPVVDVDEVDSFFQHLSQKIKDSNIGSHTFIDVQSAILNVLACKLRTY